MDLGNCTKIAGTALLSLALLPIGCVQTGSGTASSEVSNEAAARVADVVVVVTHQLNVFRAVNSWWSRSRS